jgi:hypothetical protein
MSTTWRVTADVPDQYSFDGGGSPVLGHQVSFITGEGNRGTVFVPNDHYNPAAVKVLVNGHAVTVDSVAGLTSES